MGSIVKLMAGEKERGLERVVSCTAKGKTGQARIGLDTTGQAGADKTGQEWTRLDRTGQDWTTNRQSRPTGNRRNRHADTQTGNRQAGTCRPSSVKRGRDEAIQ